MTINEAIELNKQAVESLLKGKHPTHAQAIQLGIEALTEVKKARYGDPALDGELLPGETEE